MILRFLLPPVRKLRFARPFFRAICARDDLRSPAASAPAAFRGSRFSFGDALGRFKQKSTKRTKKVLHLCFLGLLLLILQEFTG